MITISEYADCLNGYQVVDCAVRDRNSFHFIARHIEEGSKAGVLSEWKVPKREIGFYRDEPLDKRLGFQGFHNFERTFVGGTMSPVNQVVCVDVSAQVYARGQGLDDVENPIPESKDGPLRGGVSRIRMIDGRLYVVGGWHSVCRRRGPNDWESLCLNLPIPTKREFDNVNLSGDMRFEDIDAFSPEDIYVVGGRGVVWHCDGKAWHRIPFPSNMLLESVCCAGDGHVYIGAQSGTLFRGRDNKWSMLHRGQFSLPFEDIVWHAGRVWCTSDYGLWTVEGDRLIEVQLPSSDIAVCAGHLSAADGVMLMAGIHGAAFHDGQEWQLIFNRYKMEQAVAGA